MTVNKVGRPSKSQERIEQILTATAGVVARHGIVGTTLARVAEECGLQRTLVLHYFGTRESLIGRFVDHAVADYGTRMLEFDPAEPITATVRSMFEPGAYRNPADLAVWVELIALSARDTDVRDHLRHLWNDTWLPAIERRLAAEFPIASGDDVARVAYTLAALFEAHWAFAAQGIVDETRTRFASEAAERAVASLPGGVA